MSHEETRTPPKARAAGTRYGLVVAALAVAVVLAAIAMFLRNDGADDTPVVAEPAETPVAEDSDPAFDSDAPRAEAPAQDAGETGQ